MEAWEVHKVAGNGRCVADKNVSFSLAGAYQEASAAGTRSPIECALSHTTR